MTNDHRSPIAILMDENQRLRTAEFRVISAAVRYQRAEPGHDRILRASELDTVTTHLIAQRDRVEQAQATYDLSLR